MRNEFANKSNSRRRNIFRKRLAKEVSTLVDALAGSKEFPEVGERRAQLKSMIARDIEAVITEKSNSFFANSPEPEFSREKLVEEIKRGK